MDKKDKNKGRLLPFKELPVYCKVLRIVFVVFLLYGTILTIIGSATGVSGIGLTIGGLVSGILPALVIIIIDYNLEKKYSLKLDAQKEAEPQVVKEEPKPVEEEKKEPEPEPVKEEEHVDVHEEVKAANEPAKKKNKKGLIIGLSVAGGVLLLLGVAGGTVGVLYSAGAFNSSGVAPAKEKDHLPKDYVFNPSSSAIYEQSDAQFEKGSYNTYEFNKDKSFVKYTFIDKKLYMIKYGTWTYNQSEQKITATIKSYDTKYSDGKWSGKYDYGTTYDDICRIVSETKIKVLQENTDVELPFLLKDHYTINPVKW